MNESGRKENSRETVTSCVLSAASLRPPFLIEAGTAAFTEATHLDSATSLTARPRSIESRALRSYGDDRRRNPNPGRVTPGLQTPRRSKVSSRRSPFLHNGSPKPIRERRFAPMDRADRCASWYRAGTVLFHSARAYVAFVR